MSAYEHNAHIGSDRVTVSLTLDQYDLDGLNALLHWLDALEKHGGKGMIPGRHEFHMMYRGLVQNIKAQDDVPF